MTAFSFRLSALAIRFLCPLAVLALSNAEMMGKYYIFISYFSFAIALSGLELAVPFASKFLRCKNERQKRIILAAFVSNQIVITTALAIPGGVILATLVGVAPALTPLFCLALATEACVNEVCRFYWNIGQYWEPSLRDLIRATIFTVSIVGSVFYVEHILTSATFLIIIVGNICILIWELKNLTVKKNYINWHPIKSTKKAWKRARLSILSSIPQYIHMQLLGLQPLLERTLIEKNLGLAFVAAFAFLISIVQTGSGLFMTPIISNVKKNIIGAREKVDHLKVRRLCLDLLLKIFFISGSLALIAFYGLPILNLITNKELATTPWLTLVVYMTTVSAIFCSAIAPAMTKNGNALKSNLVSALILMPLLAGQYFSLENEFNNISLAAILVVALTLTASRVMFINRVNNYHQH